MSWPRRLPWQHWRWLGLGASLLLAVLCHGSAPEAALEDPLFNWQSAWLRHALPAPADQRVVVIGIDEASVAAVPEPISLWHQHWGQVLTALDDGAAAVVGLDLPLPERSYDALLPGGDAALRRGIAALARRQALVLGGGHGGGASALPLAKRMAQRAGLDTRPGRINYRIPGPASYVPLARVLAWQAAGDRNALRQAFAGKLVLIGSVLPFEGRQLQPVNLAPWESFNGKRVPSVLVQAQTLVAMAHGGLLQPVNNGLALLLAAALWLWRGTARQRAGLALLILTGGAAVSLTLLTRGLLLPLALPLLLAGAALAGGWAVPAALQLRERQRLRASLSGYVSPAVLQEILAGRLHGAMAPTLCHVCVLFADVRGYAALSAEHPSGAVLAVLNRYFELLVSAVHQQGGTVTTIMGAGLMAVFGAPLPQSDPEQRAMAAARAMLAAVHGLNAALAAEGSAPLDLALGLHAGPAIAGHVGARSRHEYSALGDTTNIAARLQHLELGYPLLCSQAVAAALGYPASLVALGPQALRGRAALAVYGAHGSPDAAAVVS